MLCITCYRPHLRPPVVVNAYGYNGVNRELDKVGKISSQKRYLGQLCNSTICSCYAYPKNFSLRPAREEHQKGPSKRERDVIYDPEIIDSLSVASSSALIQPDLDLLGSNLPFRPLLRDAGSVNRRRGLTQPCS